jgi:hypothetical protein
MTQFKWEDITKEDCELTERLKVTGGYLYHRIVHDAQAISACASMCFVPDLPKEIIE